MRHYARKTDDNQAEIVEALRSIGCFVHSTASAGDGFPDLAVAYRGRWHLIEVKDGSKPPSRRKLTPAQVKFQEAVNDRAPTPVVESVEQAIELVTKREE